MHYEFSMHGDIKHQTLPAQVGSDSDWKHADIDSWTVGEPHAGAIKEDDKLYTWGGNTYGQLGLGNAGKKTNRRTPQQVFLHIKEKK